MKHITIPQLKLEATDIKHIADVLNELEPHKIDCVNWEYQYPAKPDVEFSIAHGGDILYLQYEVNEPELLAQVDEDNGEVWTDSCVEFFVSFDEGEHYYNLEFNCIGRALVGYRKAGEAGTHASDQVMQTIQRLPSLGTHTRERVKGNFRWMLTLAIPASVFWMSNLSSFSGIEARANFYKCGDYLSNPQYLSWAEVESSTPNFHQPRFFGELRFE